MSKEQELEFYWKTLSKQKIDGLRYKIVNSIQHDLNEAQICLNRSKPNVDMALSRLANIQKVLDENTVW